MVLDGGLRSHGHPLRLGGLDATFLPNASCRRRGTVARETAHGKTGLNHVSTLDHLVQILRAEDSRRMGATDDIEIVLAAKIEVALPEAKSGSEHLLRANLSHQESAV